MRRSLIIAHAAIEVRADAVHLVREDQARNAVAVGLAPHGLGLRLDAGDGIEQRHRAVEHAQRRSTSTVKSTWPGVSMMLMRYSVSFRIQNAGRRGGRDRDAALLLLLHPVHRRGAFVHLADFVRLAGVVQDALGRSRLPGIDVGHDADVAIVVERWCACHVYPSGNEKAGRPTGRPGGIAPRTSGLTP